MKNPKHALIFMTMVWSSVFTVLACDMYFKLKNNVSLIRFRTKTAEDILNGNP